MHISLRDRAGYPIQNDSDSCPYYCLIRESKISLLASGTRHSLSTKDFSNNLHPFGASIDLRKDLDPCSRPKPGPRTSRQRYCRTCLKLYILFSEQVLSTNSLCFSLIFSLSRLPSIDLIPRCQRFLNVSLMSVSLLPHGAQ